VLCGFEDGFPVDGPGRAGWRRQDQRSATVLSDSPAEGSRYARFFWTLPDPSAYFQYGLRRRYLTSGTSVYQEGTHNALAFRIRVPPGSQALCTTPQWRFGVWTYHWRSDDIWVGGPDGTSGTTDSMMHGYANFCLAPEAAGRWVRVQLSPSAFKEQRDYYHLYAAQAVTGPLEFFPSLRQLQFTLIGQFDGVQQVDLDGIELLRRDATGRFEPAYDHRRVSATQGDVVVPVVLRNPGPRDRRYRVFISSELGVSREALDRSFAETDRYQAPTAVQKAVAADGGVGVAELRSDGGAPVSDSELRLPAGGLWRGELVHHLKPEMLGATKEVRFAGRSWTVRRNTLTTSVIAWDPDEPPTADMGYVRPRASNTDDAQHPSPPGFPRQARPAPGWRSEDVPLDQVGGYLVTEIELD
jgi:hypothetical protein